MSFEIISKSEKTIMNGKYVWSKLFCWVGVGYYMLVTSEENAIIK